MGSFQTLLLHPLKHTPPLTHELRPCWCCPPALLPREAPPTPPEPGWALPCSPACPHGGAPAVLRLWAWPQVSSHRRPSPHSQVTGKVLPAQHHDNGERAELMGNFSHLELSGKAQMGRPLLQQQEFLAHKDSLTMIASVSQVCRAKELPAGEDTGGSCKDHSGMLGFGRQRMQAKKICDCECRQKN